jgi:hypothetical protein
VHRPTPGFRYRLHAIFMQRRGQEPLNDLLSWVSWRRCTVCTPLLGKENKGGELQDKGDREECEASRMRCWSRLLADMRNVGNRRQHRSQGKIGRSGSCLLGCGILCAERNGVIDQPARIREGGTEGRAHTNTVLYAVPGRQHIWCSSCTSQEEQGTVL